MSDTHALTWGGTTHMIAESMSAGWIDFVCRKSIIGEGARRVFNVHGTKNCCWFEMNGVYHNISVCGLCCSVLGNFDECFVRVVTNILNHMQHHGILSCIVLQK